MARSGPLAPLDSQLPPRGLWAAALALVLVPGLFLRGPWPLDELRYLEVARELATGRDPFLLQLQGRPYTHKLPLLFWEVAALGRLVGLDAASRLVPALHAVLFALGCGRLVASLGLGAVAARRAALLAALCPGTIALGQAFYFDLPLAAALVWMLALRGAPFPAPWLLLALALATKGPVALLLGLPPWAALAWIERGPPGPRACLRACAGIALALLPLVLWLLHLRSQLDPASFHELVFGQTGGRLEGRLGHVKPFWFYVPVAALLAFPWLPFVARAPEGGRPPRTVRALCWTALGILLAFSLIPTKAPQYVFPLVPLVLPWAAVRLGRDAASAWHWALRSAALAGAAAGILVASGAAADLLAAGPPRLAGIAADLRPPPTTAPLIGAAVLVGAAAATRARMGFLVRWLLLWTGLSFALLPAADRMQRLERTLPALRAHLAAGRPVVQLRPLLHGNLHYLLGRTDLEIVERPEEIRRAAARQGIWIAGFAKHASFLPADLHFEVLAEESFFFRPFRVWRPAASARGGH